MTEVSIITPLEMLDRELDRLHRMYIMAYAVNPEMSERIFESILRIHDILMNPTFTVKED